MRKLLISMARVLETFVNWAFCLGEESVGGATQQANCLCNDLGRGPLAHVSKAGVHNSSVLMAASPHRCGRYPASSSSSPLTVRPARDARDTRVSKAPRAL